jgi:phage shock protein E
MYKTLLISLLFCLIIGFLIYNRAQSRNLADKAYELYNEKDALVLDVRTPSEVEAHKVPEAKNIPIQDLSAQVERLRKEYEPGHPIVVFCESGGRSAKAERILEKAQFTNVVDIKSWRNWPTCRNSKC